MVLALAFDVLVAWLLAKRLTAWWAWLPAALLGGVSVSVLYALALNLFGVLAPGPAAVLAISKAGIHALVCLFCTWGFTRRKRT